ncbi:META domain-containing protein [Massilibacteroides sp.]|uniref:META domain-containing protein n=1 Tax=Massilibacteroides sp. TaxID=2034766 RepID=UPI002602476F|nr:META domain-containing protein [Massilibacteroides sp.]MDD4514876.1 META domain-containing protein [Massilibacteroides sp.]
MKRSFWSILTVFLSVVLFSSCGASKKDVSSLISGRWNILEVAGEKITGDKLPFIEFDTAEKRLHGNAGCNNFNAGYQVDPAKISSFKISQAVSTMMACPDMETEGKVLKALDKVASVKKAASATGLQLLDNNGAVLFLLEKAL